jgi:hypothetical protein
MQFNGLANALHLSTAAERAFIDRFHRSGDWLRTHTNHDPLHAERRWGLGGQDHVASIIRAHRQVGEAVCQRI